MKNERRSVIGGVGVGRAELNVCVCVNVYMMGVWKASGSGYLKVVGICGGKQGRVTGRQGDRGRDITGRDGRASVIDGECDSCGMQQQLTLVSE